MRIRPGGELLVGVTGFFQHTIGVGEQPGRKPYKTRSAGKQIRPRGGEVREGNVWHNMTKGEVGFEFHKSVQLAASQQRFTGSQRGHFRSGQLDFPHRPLTVAEIRRGGGFGGCGHGFGLSRKVCEGIQEASSFKTVEFNFKFTEDGLIPVIVQEANGEARPSGRVLMFAWMNRESLVLTLERGLMTYWSRSRKKLWLKGESSGHTQRVVRWYVDCDKDVLLFEVEQETGACHTGYESCFFQEMDRSGNPLPVREEKMFDDGAVYSKKS